MILRMAKGNGKQSPIRVADKLKREQAACQEHGGSLHTTRKPAP
jgi:hypothetical protein